MNIRGRGNTKLASYTHADKARTPPNPNPSIITMYYGLHAWGILCFQYTYTIPNEMEQR